MSDHRLGYIESRSIPIKGYGRCLKADDARLYLEINGAKDVHETDAGITFTARGKTGTVAPLFANGHGWLWQKVALDEALRFPREQGQQK